jgi:hypothetical protein
MLYYQSTNPSRATSLYPLHTLYMDLQDKLTVLHLPLTQSRVRRYV